MFICIYKKLDNIVYQVKNDSSVPQSVTAEQHLSTFCMDNDVQVSDYAVAEMPFQKFDFVFGKFVFNSQTNSISVSVNWIEPPAVETSSIPVSDPNGGVQ
jgi:hypothetical protein